MTSFMHSLMRSFSHFSHSCRFMLGHIMWFHCILHSSFFILICQCCYSNASLNFISFHASHFTPFHFI
jgi:hypothetical protein